VIPQWRAVMKYIFWSLAVLLTSDPLQNVPPPVEITPTARTSSRQESPAPRHSTSMLQLPDLL
jgi:hypothetical protein